MRADVTRETIFRIPPVEVRVRISHAWARHNELESYAGKMSEQHDWIHAEACLGIDCEGVVLAIEECLEAAILLSLAEFAEECEGARIVSDTFTDADVRRGHRFLVSLSIEGGAA